MRTEAMSRGRRLGRLGGRVAGEAEKLGHADRQAGELITAGKLLTLGDDVRRLVGTEYRHRPVLVVREPDQLHSVVQVVSDLRDEGVWFVVRGSHLDGEHRHLLTPL